MVHSLKENGINEINERIPTEEPSKKPCLEDSLNDDDFTNLEKLISQNTLHESLLTSLNESLSTTGLDTMMYKENNIDTSLKGKSFEGKIESIIEGIGYCISAVIDGKTLKGFIPIHSQDLNLKKSPSLTTSLKDTKKDEKQRKKRKYVKSGLFKKDSNKKFIFPAYQRALASRGVYILPANQVSQQRPMITPPVFPLLPQMNMVQSPTTPPSMYDPLMMQFGQPVQNTNFDMTTLQYMEQLNCSSMK